MRVDGGVADFAGDAAAPSKDPAIDDQARTDAGGDFDECQISGRRADAPPPLRQGTEVGVIVEKDGPPKAVLEVDGDVVTLPLRQNEGQQLSRMSIVDRTRNRDADPEHVGKRHVVRLQDGAYSHRHLFESDLRLVANGSRSGPRRSHVAAQVREHARNVRRAELDPDDEARLVLKLEHDGAATATGNAGARLFDQARAQQIVDDRGHRRPTQARAPRQLCPRDLTLLPEEVQDQPTVSRPDRAGVEYFVGRVPFVFHR